MRSPVLVEQVLSAIVARLHAGGDLPPSGISGVGSEWFVTLTSLLAVLAVGGVAARVARCLARRSTPELVVLLNRSAAFYGRWPEDRLAAAPRDEVTIEASRCRRIIELLESSSGAVCDGGPASRGPIDGLRAWVAVLHDRIADQSHTPAGPAYA